MPTVTVSNSTQLASALRNAVADTTIELTSGSYTLDVRQQDYHDTVITSASGADAYFSKIAVNFVSNLIFDGVDFRDQTGTGKPFVVASSDNVTIRNATIDGQTNAGGFGLAHGLWISKDTGFTLQNSQITDFQTGLWIQADTDLTIQGNTLSNISLDGMIIGGVHDAFFIDNDIDLHVPAGTKHTDGMQFYNSVTNNPLSHVVVRDNTITTHNSASHGIYMANGLADASGDPSTFFENIVIKRNVVVSGQVSGIAVGQTNGLSVYANTVLQGTDVNSTREINVPVIRVHADSTGVGITANTTHRLPEPSGPNWFPTDQPEPSWTIANNRIVPLGTVAGNGGNRSAAPASATALDDTIVLKDYGNGARAESADHRGWLAEVLPSASASHAGEAMPHVDADPIDAGHFDLVHDTAHGFI